MRPRAGYLAGLGRPARIGRERLRQLLHERGIVIMDNLAANKTPAIRRWAGRENVERASRL
jgi:ABC-type siderophore export system fused ATPase/permease subunit